jgi:hypothetical protein
VVNSGSRVTTPSLNPPAGVARCVWRRLVRVGPRVLGGCELPNGRGLGLTGELLAGNQMAQTLFCSAPLALEIIACKVEWIYSSPVDPSVTCSSSCGLFLQLINCSSEIQVTLKGSRGLRRALGGAHSTKEDHHMRAELQQMRNQAVNISHEMMMLLRVVLY